MAFTVPDIRLRYSDETSARTRASLHGNARLGLSGPYRRTGRASDEMKLRETAGISNRGVVIPVRTFDVSLERSVVRTVPRRGVELIVCGYTLHENEIIYGDKYRELSEGLSCF